MSTPKMSSTKSNSSRMQPASICQLPADMVWVTASSPTVACITRPPTGPVAAIAMGAEMFMVNGEIQPLHSPPKQNASKKIEKSSPGSLIWTNSSRSSSR